MQEEKTKNAIPAFKITVTMPIYEKKDGVTIQKGNGSTSKFHVVEWYDKSELDWGNYWNFGEGYIELYDKDGSEISDDLDSIMEHFELSLNNQYSIQEIENKLCNPNDFFEFKVGNKNEGTLRITALSERPRLEPSMFYYDLNIKAQNQILVYGKPLISDRRISGQKLWRNDTLSWIESLIGKQVTIPNVEIKIININAGLNYEKPDYSQSHIELKLSANSIDDLRSTCRELGADVIENELNIEHIEGNDENKTYKYFTVITITNYP